MDAQMNSLAGGDDRTTVVRMSERELVVTRTFNAPARILFDAWTKADLFKRWWAPKSYGMTIVSCEMDARTGGGYKLVISHPAAPEPMAFFGRYVEVTPPSKIVWTNEEGDDEPVTTVTFEEKGGETLLVMTDLYPSKAALDEAIASGNIASAGCSGEIFAQLEELLVTVGAEAS